MTTPSRALVSPPPAGARPASLLAAMPIVIFARALATAFAHSGRAAALPAARTA
jgi:hypothetical protein